MKMSGGWRRCWHQWRRSCVTGLASGEWRQSCGKPDVGEETPCGFACHAAMKAGCVHGGSEFPGVAGSAEMPGLRTYRVCGRASRYVGRRTDSPTVLLM